MAGGHVAEGDIFTPTGPFLARPNRWTRRGGLAWPATFPQAPGVGFLVEGPDYQHLNRREASAASARAAVGNLNPSLCVNCCHLLTSPPRQHVAPIPVFKMAGLTSAENLSG